MRISIWQQFASNHSNDFTLVGEFESTEKAQEIANRLREMLRAIRADQDTYSIQPLEMDEPTQTEIQYGQLYGVEWITTLDWIAVGEALTAQVSNYDNLVFVDSLGAAWNPYPLDELLAKWGKRVLIDTALGDESIVADVHCLVSDVQQATRLFHTLDTYFKTREKGDQTSQWVEMIPPWLTFATPVVAPGLRENAVYQVWQGTIELEESAASLHLTHLDLVAPGYGLPALIAYLKAHGCTNVEYSLKAEPISDTLAPIPVKSPSIIQRLLSLFMGRR